MRERVLGRFAWAGALREDVLRLDAVLTAALRHRERTITDENDPRFLHPARTVLILLDDAAVEDPLVLSAALLLESQDPELAAAVPQDAAASALAAAVPTPLGSGERLLEELLAAPREARLVACAERLDHARHAHLLPGESLGRWLEEVRAVYLPIAARTHPLIARRFDHWARAREQRQGSR